MKVWKIDDNATDYQRLSFVEDIDGREFICNLDGFSKMNNWKALKIEFFEEDKNKEIGDFVHLLSGFFVVSDRVAKLFNESFDDSVEILPLDSVNGYSIIHILDVCSCVDYEKSIIKYFPNSEKILRIKEFSFNEEIVATKLIFKDNGFPITDIYVSDKGKEVVESWNVKGVKFVEKWDSKK